MRYDGVLADVASVWRKLALSPLVRVCTELGSLFNLCGYLYIVLVCILYYWYSLYTSSIDLLSGETMKMGLKPAILALVCVQFWIIEFGCYVFNVWSYVLPVRRKWLENMYGSQQIKISIIS